jgi:protein disulfide-isomerase
MGLFLGLGGVSSAAAEDPADPASAPVAQAPVPTAAGNQIHCETFTLADGRTMTGTYDPDKQAINIVSESSGKPLGSMAVAAADIVSRKPLIITVATEKPRGSDGQWLDNYTVAMASAHATHRPILIDFTGSDWCPWCIKLHNEVLSSPVFKAWAAQHVILLLADFPHDIPQSATVQAQNRHLQSVYAITGYPTVILIDGAGKKLAVSGYNSLAPHAWIADLAQQANLRQ